MLLSAPCRSCQATESHGYKSTPDGIVCASCTSVSVAGAWMHSDYYKKQRDKHAKDIVQPYRYKRGKQEMNPDFKKLYPAQAKAMQSAPPAAPVRKLSDTKATVKNVMKRFER